MRTWFNIGDEERITWKKPEYKKIEWYKKDPDSLKAMERDLLPKIGKKISFSELI